METLKKHFSIYELKSILYTFLGVFLPLFGYEIYTAGIGDAVMRGNLSTELIAGLLAAGSRAVIKAVGELLIKPLIKRGKETQPPVQ